MTASHFLILFQINPFVNVNLQIKQSETVRSQNSNIRKNTNKIKTSEAKTIAKNDDIEKRVSIPRQSSSRTTSNRPKIFIDKDEFDDSFEEESNNRGKLPQRKEQKKNKEEQKEKRGQNCL